MKILICSDVHCRDFYKPILEVKDTPIVFLGDYLDPYPDEGCSFEDGFANLEEIIDFAKNNHNVTLLVGNHDNSYIWEDYGCSRFNKRFYNDAHALFRENLELFKPFKQFDEVIFSHAGISKGWIDVNKREKFIPDDVDLNGLLDWINSEWNKECCYEGLIKKIWYTNFRSTIFDIGYIRGGEAPYGGPFWCDISEMLNPLPIIQIFGHTQLQHKGTFINVSTIRNTNHVPAYCVDSREIFEFNTETKELKIYGKD